MKKTIPDDAVLVPDSADLAFSGMIFDVFQWPQILFDGSEQRFEMLKRSDTVSVIALVQDKIVVLDDEQPHSGARESFPGGRVDDTDATILAAAQREMREETGYVFHDWRLIKVWQPYRKIEWFVHVYVAWDVASKEQAHLDAGEKITVHELDFDQVQARVLRREGYLGESAEIFEALSSIDDLKSLPEFVGTSVDR